MGKRVRRPVAQVDLTQPRHPHGLTPTPLLHSQASLEYGLLGLFEVLELGGLELPHGALLPLNGREAFQIQGQLELS